MRGLITICYLATFLLVAVFPALATASGQDGGSPDIGGDAAGEDAAIDDAADDEPAGGDAPIVTFGAESDLSSRYIWRGTLLDTGPVFQPSIWVSAFDVTLSLLSSASLDRHPGGSGYSSPPELDPSIAYSAEVAGLTIEPSLYFYTYPGGAFSDHTGELMLGLSYALAGPLSVYTTHAVDIVSCAGAYYGEAGLSVALELPRGFYLDALAGVGWGSSRFWDANMDRHRPSAGALLASLALTWYPIDYLYLRGHWDMSVLLSDRLRQAVPAGDAGLLAIGLAIGFEYG